MRRHRKSYRFTVGTIGRRTRRREHDPRARKNRFMVRPMTARNARRLAKKGKLQ